MEADFFQVETPDHITIFDNTDAVVARFTKTQHGYWAYHSFNFGALMKGMSVYSKTDGQYVVGSIGQLEGEAA